MPHPQSLHLSSSLGQSPMLVSLNPDEGRRVPWAPAWSPNGQMIAFLWPHEGRKQLWLWTPADGHLRQLTHPPFHATNGWRSVMDRTMTDRPQWAPHGESICCAGRSGRHDTMCLWLITPEGEITRLTWPDPGEHRSPSWSPDGRRIAYVSRRDGKDELWLTPVGGEAALQLIWDRFDNSDPRWSPDGRHIAFTTQRYERDPLITQCGILDMTNGATEILTDDGSTHSRYPRWGSDGLTLYFLSDRSGFDEIWRLDLRGRRPEQVTRHTGQDKHGEFALSPDGRRLAYISVRHACHDLEVMRVGGDPHRLNAFDGVCRWPAWSPDGRLIAVFAESPDMPPELRVFDTDSGEEVHRTTCSPAREFYAGVEVVSFATFDGRQLDGVLCAGESRPQESFVPAVLNIHGGPNDQYVYDYDPYIQYLAEAGFVILSPNCRGSTGYGRDFMDLNINDWGGGDYRDWLAAVEWLKKLSMVDPSRLAMWGRSYGGFATLTALGKAPEVFRCGVCHFGPTDLAEFFRITRRRQLLMHYMGLPWLSPEAYRAQSPMTYVDSIRAPLLVLHGGNDPGVPPAESQRIVNRLRQLGREVDYECYPGEDHGFDQPDHVLDAAERITAFLRRHTLATS